MWGFVNRSYDSRLARREANCLSPLRGSSVSALSMIPGKPVSLLARIILLRLSSWNSNRKIAGSDIDKIMPTISYKSKPDPAICLRPKQAVD